MTFIVRSYTVVYTHAKAHKKGSHAEYSDDAQPKCRVRLYAHTLDSAIGERYYITFAFLSVCLSSVTLLRPVPTGLKFSEIVLHLIAYGFGQIVLRHDTIR